MKSQTLPDFRMIPSTDTNRVSAVASPDMYLAVLSTYAKAWGDDTACPNCGHERQSQHECCQLCISIRERPQ